MYVNKKKKSDFLPFIDRILNNPLSFIQSTKEEYLQELDNDKMIVLSNKKQKLNNEIAKGEFKKQKLEKKRPKSMAEAVAEYTGKKYGISSTRDNRKRKRVELSDSEVDVGIENEDEGKPVTDLILKRSDQDDEEDNFESASEYPPNENENEKIQDAGKSSSSSDDDYLEKEKSESDSVSLSEEPEDLQKLKEDLKRDQALAQFQSKTVADENTTQLSYEDDDANETVNIDFSKFYDINEIPNDKGTNGSTRINKTWPHKYANRKPIGLLNQGVTCYMNTGIQTMIHIPVISNYLEDVANGKYDKVLPPKSVTHVLADLSARLWNIDNNSKKNCIHPKKIIGRLQDINCMMSEWQQEDSHEYFMSLMSRLQEDSTPKGHKLNESIIYDIFGGLLNQTVFCEQCKNKSITKQEFYDLSLGFNKRKKLKYSIEQSIEEFFNKESIKVEKEAKSGYFCETCKKNTNAIKSSTIDRSPEVLTIHLKRFKFNGSQSLKVKQSIKYSKYLDLSKFATKKDNTSVYKLISVISHEGRSILSGHYIAHCLQPDNTWCTYDDEYINKINEVQAMNDPSAYVLIYSKLTPKAKTLKSSKL